VTLRHSGWLDRLALRSLARPVQGGDTHGVALRPEEQFSRNTAIKLALAGAVSISLGLWRTAPVLAQDREACFTRCLKEHDEELARRINACKVVFQPRVIRRTEPGSWGRLRGFFSYGGERDVLLGATALQWLCDLKAEHRLGLFKNDCYDACEETCRKRSMQSSSGRSAATCEVTPPQHAPPPTVPPIPSPTAGVSAECANCALAGGQCCAGKDPTKLCACAHPALDCQERYGCGS